MTKPVKRFVVTGVSSGVGAATARVLLNAGHAVVGVDIRPAVQEGVEFHHCDLSDPLSVAAFVAGLQGPIDGLANIAGVPGSAPLELVAKVNFLGLRALTEALLPRISDGGVVINVASTAGANWRARKELVKQLLCTPDWQSGLEFMHATGLDAIAAYDFTKEAVILYTMQIASQERHRGVRVNSVSPGAVQTPILKDFYDTMGDDLLGRLKAQAGGRDATPDEVADVIAVLLTAPLFWMNGTDLIVDGGAEVLMNLDELAVAPAPLASACGSHG